MISCPSVTKQVIRGHYNLVTPFYRLLWGPHIHHGLWEADESPRRAQLRLIEQMAELASITTGERVIDVGCGMGGSAIHLAKSLQCRVTGVTISRVQQRWASLSAHWHRVRGLADFQCNDAESVELPSDSADVVWSIECTEHLFDKPRFFQNAAQWLRPGGRVAICAWLAGPNMNDDQQREQVYRVCDGFFCPSLGSKIDYQQWMEAAGLQVDSVHDWTPRVSRTWEICARRARRFGMRPLATLLDRNAVLFLDRFETILNAYRSGAMEYGCFIATKPK